MAPQELNFYLVYFDDGGRTEPIWVACIDPDELVYVWINQDQKFHLNEGLTYLLLSMSESWDTQPRFVPINAAATVEACRSGMVGVLPTGSEDREWILEALMDARALDLTLNQLSSQE